MRKDSLLDTLQSSGECDRALGSQSTIYTDLPKFKLTVIHSHSFPNLEA
ncbi:MAG: hypothetical protein PUP92_00300 [Rhizonema sp. PD38]|nr:hypothetical protein [Rhizonema sp. PD38]